jgi:phosphoribosylamine--glycine ligase
MGGYSPSVHVDAETFRVILDDILVPTIAGMAEDGRPYRGILYIGLMLTTKGPKVLEYNARFGDPEAELIAVRMKSDLVPLLQSTLAGGLEEAKIDWLKARAACVVLAARGYPGDPEKGHAISGLEEAEAMGGVEVFHAGTAVKEGKYVTDGGRVLTVTSLGGSFAEATGRCYAAAGVIQFDGKHFRSDIARDALEAVARKD